MTNIGANDRTSNGGRDILHDIADEGNVDDVVAVVVTTTASIPITTSPTRPPPSHRLDPPALDSASGLQEQDRIKQSLLKPCFCEARAALHRTSWRSFG